MSQEGRNSSNRPGMGPLHPLLVGILTFSVIHPPSLLAPVRTPEGKICILDYGLMTQVTAEMRKCGNPAHKCGTYAGRDIAVWARCGADRKDLGASYLCASSSSPQITEEQQWAILDLWASFSGQFH